MQETASQKRKYESPEMRGFAMFLGSVLVSASLWLVDYRLGIGAAGLFLLSIGGIGLFIGR